jgi:hypothetical protein
LDSRKWDEHNFLTAFSKFKSHVTSAEEAEYSGHLPTGQTDQNVDTVRELIFKNKIITIHDILNKLGFHLGQSKSTLKDKEPESGIWGIGLSTITTHLLALHGFLAQNKMTVIPHPPYL